MLLFELFHEILIEVDELAAQHEVIDRDVTVLDQGYALGNIVEHAEVIGEVPRENLLALLGASFKTII